MNRIYRRVWNRQLNALVVASELATGDIYRGVVPFIGLQLLMLALVAAFPVLATGLPEWLYG